MSQDNGYKTLAIRLEDPLHAQLAVLAELTDTTITATIRQAIEAYIAAARNQGDLAAKASGAVDEIERQANVRKDAIASMFGSAPETPTPKAKVRAV